jgi:hypothetical protein
LFERRLREFRIEAHELLPRRHAIAFLHRNGFDDPGCLGPEVDRDRRLDDAGDKQHIFQGREFGLERLLARRGRGRLGPEPQERAVPDAHQDDQADHDFEQSLHVVPSDGYALERVRADRSLSLRSAGSRR